MVKYYSVTAVACSRGKVFDAEVAFTVEEGLDKRSTTQKVVAKSLGSRESAMVVARQHVDVVEKIIEQYSYAYLRKFKTAEE